MLSSELTRRVTIFGLFRVRFTGSFRRTMRCTEPPIARDDLPWGFRVLMSQIVAVGELCRSATSHPATDRRPIGASCSSRSLVVLGDCIALGLASTIAAALLPGICWVSA